MEFSFSNLIAGLSLFSKVHDGCLIKDITDRSRKAKGVGCLKGTDLLRRGCFRRGDAAGHCLLINRAPGNPAATHGLRVMEREHDGFKIAEADLAQRGQGKILGTRQSGLGDFRLAIFARDAWLLLDARQEAQAWLRNDPDLDSAESAAIREVLLQR